MAKPVFVRLSALLETIGEEATQRILANYSCPKNPDIEHFLLHSAISFDRQGLARTHLAFQEYRGQHVLVGYFALATTVFSIRKSPMLSNTLCKRIEKFSVKDSADGYTITAPLIAQLGKNYTNGYDKLIAGGQLLNAACEIIQAVQQVIGGKIIFLECEDHPQLIQFYKSYGFRESNRREIQPKDDNQSSATCYIQMFRYF